MPRPIAFALPGSIDTVTGGTIYDRHLVEGLRELGHAVEVLTLPTAYPFPTEADSECTRATLSAVPAETVLIVDGLALGAFDDATLDAIRAPLVGMVHHPLGLETGLDAGVATALVASETAALARAVHVIVPSPFTARTLTGDFAVPPDRITVALPGFPPPDPVRTPADPPLVLSVGLLAPRKGHDTLIDALAQIEDLPWQAVIVGAAHDPAHAAALHARAASLGDRLVFRGLVDPAGLTDLFRSAHVFALASRYEGYGMVFSEAICHGLPVVGCAVGAVPDTVPVGAGHLVPPGDTAAFAAALRRLLTDPVHHAACASAARSAALRLPRWSATAAVVSARLDQA
jgi:glycosyltransferase involved in cell wall biosynthesis